MSELTPIAAVRSQSSELRLLAGAVGGMTPMVVLLIVASFPRFFIFNPFSEGDPVRAGELALSTLGWVLLVVGPLTILVRFASGRRDLLRFLPFVALFWPLSLLISHTTLALTTGNWYFGYLLQYPLFAITDIVIPSFLLYVYDVLRVRETSVNRTSRRTSSKSYQDQD